MNEIEIDGESLHVDWEIMDARKIFPNCGCGVLGNVKERATSRLGSGKVTNLERKAYKESLYYGSNLFDSWEQIADLTHVLANCLSLYAMEGV